MDSIGIRFAYSLLRTSKQTDDSRPRDVGNSSRNLADAAWQFVRLQQYQHRTAKCPMMTTVLLIMQN